MAGGLKRQLELANERIEPIEPEKTSPAPKTAEAHEGMVHVISHSRDGHAVREYWRRRPSR